MLRNFETVHKIKVLIYKYFFVFLGIEVAKLVLHSLEMDMYRKPI